MEGLGRKPLDTVPLYGTIIITLFANHNHNIIPLNGIWDYFWNGECDGAQRFSYLWRAMHPEERDTDAYHKTGYGLTLDVLETWIRARLSDGTIPGKKYDEAFGIYCRTPGEPDLIAIARKVGANAETMVEFAARREWAKKRGLVLAQSATLATKIRVEVAAQVDSEAVREFSALFGQLTGRLKKYADIICALPVDDPDVRIRAQQVAKGLELTNETTKAISGLVETGARLGLILGAKGTGQETGKLDFSKLTNLTLVLQQAQKDAGIKPVQGMGGGVKAVL